MWYDVVKPLRGSYIPTFLQVNLKLQQQPCTLKTIFILYAILVLRIVCTSIAALTRSHRSKGKSDRRKWCTKFRTRHHFLAQFFILFHMVRSVFLQVLVSETTFWQIEFFFQNSNQKLPFLWVPQLNLQTKWITPCEKVELCWKLASEVVYNFIFGHFWFWKDMPVLGNIFHSSATRITSFFYVWPCFHSVT